MYNLLKYPVELLHNVYYSHTIRSRHRKTALPHSGGRADGERFCGAVISSAPGIETKAYGQGTINTLHILAVKLAHALLQTFLI